METPTPIHEAIAYGITAPNPHNTQAWRFRLLSGTEALLYLDARRLLPATDPPARQIHIGAGCCVETLAVGMSAHGHAVAVEWLPEGPHGLAEIGCKPVARIALRPRADLRADALVDGIGRRQTNRKPYTGPAIDAGEVDRIRSLVAPPEGIELQVLTEAERMRPLLGIFERAMAIELTGRHLYEETRTWFRFDERQRRTLRDGLSVPQLGFDGLAARLMEWSLFRGHPLAWFNPLAIRSGLASTDRGIASSRGLALLRTRDNDQRTWLETGRTFARLHLALTQLGLTCQPYSQVLQEYPEMAALQAEFNQLLGVRGPAKVQMAVRLGRAARSYPAPRRAVEDFINR